MVYRILAPMRIQKVVWLADSATYPKAWALAKSEGMRLASLPLVDKLVMEKDKRIKQACWVNELIAHPPKDGQFRTGEDIIDAQTGWKLPWEVAVTFIAATELVRKGIGLFIKPSKDWDGEGQAVQPASISLIHPFMQLSGWGKVDPETRIPLEISAEEIARLSYGEQRYLWRLEHSVLRPLVRYGDYYFRRSVSASYWAPDRIGVVGVFDVDESGRRI